MFSPLSMVSQDQQDATLASLTPEQLRQLVQAAGANQQRADLEKQEAQIAALRRPAGADYSKSPTGAALGGMGDVVRQATAAYGEAQLRKQREKILNQQLGAGGDYMQTLADAMRRKNINDAFNGASPPGLDMGGAFQSAGGIYE